MGFLRKVKILSAIALVSLLILILILSLAIGPKFAFFLIGSCGAALIFVVLMRYSILHMLGNDATVYVARVNIFAFALAAILLVIVILSCLRFGSSETFDISWKVDLSAFLSLLSSTIIYRILDFCRRKSQTEMVSAEEEPELEFSYLRHAAVLPRRIPYEELRSATNNFHTPIGTGGSGSVFKGFLGDGLPIAVKRIEREMFGGREFRLELTAILSILLILWPYLSSIQHIQHVNLVRILGYCLVPGGHRFIVYEFIENGSLDSWIFPGRGAREIYLAWDSRYRVAIDVAKALSYLHHECHLRILHLDVKPQNILLDENFRARVSDFGISRMMGRDESRVVTTLRGTSGYLAPEWFSGEGISEKSDVYSYGMVLLELMGGRRNVEFIDNNSDTSQRTWLYFPKIVSEKMREGKLMEVVDERLARDGVVEVEQLRIYVALWCIQERPELRPSMELVVGMLQGHIDVGMPPESRMFMVDFAMPVGPQINGGPGGTNGPTSEGETQLPCMSTHSFSVSTVSGR